MFPSNDRQRPSTASPAPRLVGTLRLIRSFLLLEDDYEVDWEVGQDEHPHRRPARARRGARRPGAVEQAEQVCSCPLPAVRRGTTPANQPRTTAGRPVGGPHV
jgi:hypothetical protein